MKKRGFLPAAVLVLTILGGCSRGGGAKTPPPIATPTPTVAASPAAGLDPAISQTITDGICITLIPDDWTDSGNGRGFTPSGARFILFGNVIAGDSAWTAAAGIIATAAAGQGAKPQQTANSIMFAKDDGTAFELRRRLGDRYCDFSVTSSSKAPDDERATWRAVGASMAAASETVATP